MTPGNDELEARAIALFEMALEHSSDSREDWVRAQTLSDIALLDHVLTLLKHDKTSASAIHTGQAMLDTLDSTTMPEKIGAYRITKLIGQGGMGAVYLGERVRNDFEHVAAIKVIRRGILSDKLIARFEMERQTLANLAHPNIARLFDGGTTEHGAPYIIMEYIDGAPITEWAEAKNLPLQARLKLFTETSKAVQHLHQNLIVHRDITPSNVLVTQSGEVKLIDMGIAKPYDETAEIVDGGHSLESLTFTPGFAAPERSKGAEANTLSDIYSLGKLLEALLPHNTNRELRAIITKATQPSPANRYAAVEALIEDVEHFTSGHAVDAFNVSSPYKFKKFIMRNRAASGLGALAVTALIGGLMTTSFQYRQAETARIEADKRFNDVRSLANTMMFDIYDDMDFVPGALEAKVNLASAAQSYLDELSAVPKAPNDVKIETAKGYIRLGEILGSPRMSNAGEFDRAKVSFEKADAMLMAMNPDETTNIATLSALRKLEYLKATHGLYVEARTAEAEAFLKQSLSYAERAAALDPENLDLATDVLQTRMELAINARWDDRMEEALAEISAVIESYEKLEASQSGQAKILEELAKALRTKTEFLSLPETANEAIPLAQRAIAIEIERGSSDPDAPLDQLRAMAFSYWRLAQPYFFLKDNENAVINYEKAIEYTRYIVERDPGNEDARRLMSAYQGEVASSLVNLGRHGEAERHIRASRDYFKAKYDSDPNQGSAQRAMMVMHVQLYMFYKSWNKEGQRCEHLEKLQSYRDIMEFAGTLMESDKAGVAGFVKSEPACQ